MHFIVILYPVHQLSNNHWKVYKHYYDHIFSHAEINNIITHKDVQYTRDIDTAKYENGVRSTLNPPGKANLNQVKSFLQKGCSVRSTQLFD